MQPIGNPGAMKYGNFINYYQYNAAEDRLKLLPNDIWLTEQDNDEISQDKPYLLLDVGCNTGELTQLCWQHISANAGGRAVYALGLDLDEVLIERAAEMNSQRAHITYECIDVMNEKQFEAIIGKYLEKFNCIRFDAICCFSVTMWIHLNHHDAGLQNLLRRLSNLTDLLVIEPQPWKCYQNAQRRMHRVGKEFPLFLELKWRSELDKKIDDFMQLELKRQRIAKTKKTPWQRELFFYRFENK